MGEDWRAEQVGSRGGWRRGFPSRAATSTYGAVRDEDSGAGHAVVSDADLRRVGGQAYLRSIEILVAHRLHGLTRGYDDNGLLVLRSQVSVAEGFSDDYSVKVVIDEDPGAIVSSQCTCPAAARNHGMCKHVIALVRTFNDDSASFARVGTSIPVPARRGSRSAGTSVALRRFLSEETRRERHEMHERQVRLLRVVGAMSHESGDAASGPAGHAPDFREEGGITLRPRLSRGQGGWLVRLGISSSDGASYVVKDVSAFLSAVRDGDRVEYGRHLAFVHESRMFDGLSRELIDIIDRAQSIRRAMSGGYGVHPWRSSQTGRGGMLLTDEETCEILDLYTDADATLGYAPEDGAAADYVQVRVVDGDPDMGLVITPAEGPEAAPGSYTIAHRRCIDDVIPSRRRGFVVVRDAGYAVDPAARSIEIHRAGREFISHRDLIDVLCSPVDSSDMTVAAGDVDQFSRVVLPQLKPQGGTGIIAATIPPELVGRRREPCVIEIYLDRDRSGVTCDLQARYGRRRFAVFDGSRPDDPVERDTATERLAVEAVRQYFPRPDGPVARIPDDDDEAIHELITQGVTLLRRVGTVFCTSAFDGLTRSSRVTIRYGLSLSSGLVEISPIADDVDPADVPGILASLRGKKRFHRLRNGSFVELSNVDARSIDRVSADLDLDRSDFDGGSVDVPLFEGFYLAANCDEGDQSREFRAAMRPLTEVAPDAYRIPDSFSGSLRPYQMEGFRWLNALWDKGFGGVLADEMGLGKTVQLLALLAARTPTPSTGERRRTAADAPQIAVPQVAVSQVAVSQAAAESGNRHAHLIVCPASLVYNWTAECARFAPKLRVVAVAGSKSSRRSILADAEKYDVMVTSYDLLRRDVNDYHGVPFLSMTLDEAQAIKNHTTKAARAVRSIDALHRFALTGTPIENRLAELWSLFDVLDPGMLGRYSHFREVFDLPIISGDEEAQRRLQNLVEPFILRRRKADVLDDLPDKIDNVITVRLEGAQRRLYAALEQRLRATISHDDSAFTQEGRIRVLAQLTRLRQACCDPRLVDDDAVVAAQGDCAKLDAITDLVSSCRDEGRKMLVFSQFTSFLDLIGERLDQLEVPYDVITGSTAKKRRLDLVNSFNTDDTPVFLISLKAGNTGLNLTGASVVVHADPWWNAAAQEQANDRAHRIGQTRDVDVYRLVAQDTIEERIIRLQQAKSVLASRFVDQASSDSVAPLSSLTRESLLAMLGA
ncbi:helicase [Bifidobacterium minimum]|uniref:Helicase n=1 Tax=Bifidobacterium minimum TaxID=1693 RepID=A0A087BMU6_9BIFI|nr:DEAD/DEAH box helicase [Bifidobacterium minimum]KFI72346.1 helicase [Bifidobacterium minimum]